MFSKESAHIYMIQGYIFGLTCIVKGVILMSALHHLVGQGVSEIHFHTWVPCVQWCEPPGKTPIHYSGNYNTPVK